MRYLGDAVHVLRAMGSEVVVGTCPDLGTIRPLAQPLRYVARRLSRSLAAAQTIAVVEAGGRTVSLGDLLGPLFAERLELFSDDQFHPSAQGYAHAADAMLPSALDALGLHTRSRSASTFTTRRARPVAKAAVQAAARPGTEVAATDVHGEAEGRRGRWARLRRRRPQHPVHTSPEQARPVARPELTSLAHADVRAHPAGGRTHVDDQPLSMRSPYDRLPIHPGVPMSEAVIVATARSPIGRAGKGSLVDVRPDDITAQVIRAALDKVPAVLDDPTMIDDLYIGCGQPGGEQGFNLAGSSPSNSATTHCPAPRSTGTARHPCRPRAWRFTPSRPARATSSSRPASRWSPGSSTARPTAWPDTHNQIFADAEARTAKAAGGGTELARSAPRQHAA